MPICMVKNFFMVIFVGGYGGLKPSMLEELKQKLQENLLPIGIEMIVNRMYSWFLTIHLINLLKLVFNILLFSLTVFLSIAPVLYSHEKPVSPYL